MVLAVEAGERMDRESRSRKMDALDHPWWP